MTRPRSWPNAAAPALAAAAFVASAPAAAAQGGLGGGDTLEVSLGRIVAATIICIMVAALALLLIRQRGGRIDLRGLASRMELRPRAIDVVETRRLSAHADIGVVRHGGREYLLVVTPAGARVLSNRAVAEDRAPEPRTR